VGAQFEDLFEIHKEYLAFETIKCAIVMPKRIESQRKKRNQMILVEDNAARTLRTLKDAESFYFYETVGKPTGQCAKSLEDFLDKIESIKPESLLFHHERNDFKNWIANTLEDPKLAQKIEMIPKKDCNQIRKKIKAAVKTRLQQLEGISVQICEPEIVQLPHSSNMPTRNSEQ
jgi:hypothetical protein